MPIETMTSRERITKTIRGEKVDRVPIDLGVHFSTGISGFAYYNLRKYLGLSTDNITMIDMVQLLANVDADIRELFHVDTILLNPIWENTKKWNPRGNYTFNIPNTCTPVLQKDGAWTVDFNDSHLVMPHEGYFFDGAWPDYYNMEPDHKILQFAKRAEKIFKESDYFTMMMGFSGYFHGIDFACDMITDPEACLELNERLLTKEIEHFNKINKAMGKYIGAIEVNSDLGTQSAAQCRPTDYSELCAPFLKKFCDHVHNTSDIKVFMHSCGAISQVLPAIIDSGIDMINPVQISANNMNPQYLKDTFGDKITFWGGGCDTQNVLANVTPKEIDHHVKSLMDTFKPNGKFIFNQVHNIMGNVPPENIVAMFKAAYENSFYVE
ncbi:MAG: hypothetical protein H7X94_00440 [Vallitaleaceae bacterium]|nr:hypothetical protein [Vallitaleaceae bacterium]